MEYKKIDKLYRGMNTSMHKDILERGFTLNPKHNGGGIMFTSIYKEAERYAKSYCTTSVGCKPIEGEEPIVITIDSSGFKIVAREKEDDKLRIAEKLFAEGLADGVYSDTNPIAEYYVVYNVEKLNNSIRK